MEIEDNVNDISNDNDIILSEGQNKVFNICKKSGKKYNGFQK